MPRRAKVNTRRISAVALGVAALAIPAAAVANNGHGHGKNPIVSYVFKGTYAGNGHVDVARGNRHVRRADLLGDIEFNLADTRLSVADTNSDTLIDATDVLSGDAVVVKARLHKNDPGPSPFAARHLVDQTNPADDSDDTEDSEDADG